MKMRILYSANFNINRIPFKKFCTNKKNEKSVNELIQAMEYFNLSKDKRPSLKEIQLLYIKQVKLKHPDYNKSSNANEEFTLLKKNYDLLLKSNSNDYYGYFKDIKEKKENKESNKQKEKVNLYKDLKSENTKNKSNKNKENESINLNQEKTGDKSNFDNNYNTANTDNTNQYNKDTNLNDHITKPKFPNINDILNFNINYAKSFFYNLNIFIKSFGTRVKSFFFNSKILSKKVIFEMWNIINNSKDRKKGIFIATKENNSIGIKFRKGNIPIIEEMNNKIHFPKIETITDNLLKKSNNNQSSINLNRNEDSYDYSNILKEEDIQNFNRLKNYIKIKNKLI